MRKIALVMTALAASALGTSAQAATFMLTPTTPTDNTSIGGSPGSHIVSGTSTCSGAAVAGFACSFSTTFNFASPAGFTLSSATISSNYTDSQLQENIDFTSASLNGAALTFIPSGQNEFGFVNNVPLATSGLNSLIVNGNAGTTQLGANASFSGVLSFAPGGVPEPGTWAMMLVGFGAVGFGMRRRSATMLRIQAA
ncbi:MAG: FxDxF family PEP-CTERM protein [Sphingomonadales bacterium]|nr:FxDxF family PEP-CTERM protein [Sphingomonadales bacterium]